MFRRVLVIGSFLALAVSPAVGADVSSSPAKLTAEQVIEKNVAARGGLQAWRAVETLSMSGKMDVGGNETPALRVQGVRTGGVQLPKRPAEQMQLPFRLELKRARKSPSNSTFVVRLRSRCTTAPTAGNYVRSSIGTK